MFCYIVKGKLFLESADEKTIRIFDNYTSAKHLFEKIVGYIYAELCETFYEVFTNITYDDMYTNREQEDVYWKCECNGDLSEKLNTIGNCNTLGFCASARCDRFEVFSCSRQNDEDEDDLLFSVRIEVFPLNSEYVDEQYHLW